MEDTKTTLRADEISELSHGIIKHFNAAQTLCHRIANDHGWWEEPEWIKAVRSQFNLPMHVIESAELAAQRNEAEMIALMHSELSEAVESIRHGNPPSDHIPEFSGVEEELADVIIRIFDLAERKGYRIAEAMIAKMKFNDGRPYRHGGKKI